MDTIKVTRIHSTPAGLFGSISINHEPICWSLEPNWRMNKSNDSCILPGTYFYKHYLSPKFKRMCIGLHDVFGRQYIAMHQGNILKDTRGCILPGMYIGNLEGHTAVSQSTRAMDLILYRTTELGTIVITNNY